MEIEGRGVPHAADRPRGGDPLLHARPGRLHDRSRPGHRYPARRSRQKAPAGHLRVSLAGALTREPSAGVSGTGSPPFSGSEVGRAPSPALRSGSTPELIEDGVTGFLAEDVDDLVE